MILKLRQEFDLDILLEVAQLPRSTFYYHSKRQKKEDKYAQAKAAITAIYHENKPSISTFDEFDQFPLDLAHAFPLR